MSQEQILPGILIADQQMMNMAPPVPATSKQIEYATSIARKIGKDVPTSLFSTRHGLSQWIDRNKPRATTGQFANYPSSKQVAFAERIARLKRGEVPYECFRDKTLMSRWIEGNKPR